MKVAFLFFALLLVVSTAYSQGMVAIPAGEFTPLYGSTKGVKQKERVESFDMDIYPITVGEYQSFLRKFPQWKKQNIKKIFSGKDYLRSWKGDRPSPTIDQKSPITEISWFAAKAYCSAQGKRLPTIMEWEYAASNDLQKNQDMTKKILDWYAEPNSERLGKVGSTFENKFGIWDLHGLIWEWTLDFNSSMVTGESRGDSSLEKSMYCGSGSINAAKVDDYAAFMRFAMRSSLKANYATKNLGFRCVRSIQ